MRAAGRAEPDDCETLISTTSHGNVVFAITRQHGGAGVGARPGKRHESEYFFVDRPSCRTS
jgi:hypothetical protein